MRTTKHLAKAVLVSGGYITGWCLAEAVGLVDIACGLVIWTRRHP